MSFLIPGDRFAVLYIYYFLVFLSTYFELYFLSFNNTEFRLLFKLIGLPSCPTSMAFAATLTFSKLGNFRDFHHVLELDILCVLVYNELYKSPIWLFMSTKWPTSQKTSQRSGLSEKDRYYPYPSQVSIPTDWTTKIYYNYNLQANRNKNLLVKSAQKN